MYMMGKVAVMKMGPNLSRPLFNLKVSVIWFHLIFLKLWAQFNVLDPTGM